MKQERLWKLGLKTQAGETTGAYILSFNNRRVLDIPESTLSQSSGSAILFPCAGRGQNCFGRHMAFTARLSPRDSVVDFRIDFGIQPLQMELVTVKIEKPEAINFVLGQTHFIKTVEDIHETLVAAVPGIQFGLAFCEASGKCLVRWSGTDALMIKLAQENAQAVAAGHSFFIFFGEGFYPINVLNALKNVPEVCGIYCATANPVEVIIAATEQGRAILGVVDGRPPKALEEEADIAWRKGLLRQIGYKL